MFQVSRKRTPSVILLQSMLVLRSLLLALTRYLPTVVFYESFEQDIHSPNNTGILPSFLKISEIVSYLP